MHHFIFSLPNELFYQVISVKVIYASELFWTFQEIKIDKDLTYQLKLQGLSLWLLYHYQGGKNINFLHMFMNWPPNICHCKSQWLTLPAAGALSTFLVIWIFHNQSIRWLVVSANRNNLYHECACMVFSVSAPPINLPHSGCYGRDLAHENFKGIFLNTTWWGLNMDMLSILLAIFVGDPPVTCGFPSQRARGSGFQRFLFVSLDKLLNKQLLVILDVLILT